MESVLTERNAIKKGKSLIEKALARFAELGIADALALFGRDKGTYDFVYQYPPSITLEEHDQKWSPSIFPKDLSLYLHVPFCPTRCTFCHYYRMTKPGSGLVQHYLASIVREIELWEERAKSIKTTLKSSTLHSIYFGGGTPSYLDATQMKTIIDAIKEHFTISNDAEICLEATPDTITEDYIVALKKIGFNRISIGVQSFDDARLRRMNRHHSAQEAKDAIVMAKRHMAVNMDLLFGLPDQTPIEWAKELMEAREVEPDQLTAFLVRIKDNTMFSQVPLSRFPDEGISALMQLMTMEAFKDYHMIHDNQWSKTGSFTFQEEKWRGNQFIGIGPSSYSYLDGLVFNNIPKLTTYIDRINNNSLPIGVSRELDDQERLRRHMVLGIKVADGVDLDTTEAFGIDAKELFAKEIEFLCDEGLASLDKIDEESTCLKPTSKGLVFINEIATIFYSEAIQERLNMAKKLRFEQRAIEANYEP